jgi:hypothetical protein
MHCSQVQHSLDEYLDAALDDKRNAEIALHVMGCPECCDELDERQSLREMLQTLAVDGPDEGFLDRAVLQADQTGAARLSERDRRLSDRPETGSRWISRGAIAAAVGLVFITAVLLTAPSGPRTAPLIAPPSVTLAADTVTPVKLMFASDEALEDARFSLQLPVGVELVGYDGRTNLSWTTDLEPGKNLLRLPLVGRIPGSSELVARLEHPKGTKTFRLQITVN